MVQLTKTKVMNEQAKNEAIEIIENLMAYGKIHTVSGVRYPTGSHAEFIEKADAWLWKNRKPKDKV